MPFNMSVVFLTTHDSYSSSTVGSVIPMTPLAIFQINQKLFRISTQSGINMNGVNVFVTPGTRSQYIDLFLHAIRGDILAT